MSRKSRNSTQFRDRAVRLVFEHQGQVWVAEGGDKRGSGYLSIRHSERLAEAGIESSVISRGNSYDRPYADTINGLYENEVIYRRGRSRDQDAIEYATPERGDWFKNQRLLAPVGNAPSRRV